MRVLNYSNFLIKSDKLEEKSSSLSFYGAINEEKTLKYPIEIKGGKSVPTGDTFDLGMKDWDVITDYSEDGDTIKIKGGRYKQRGAKLSDFEPWDDKYLDDDLKVVVKKSKNPDGYKAAKRIVDAVKKASAPQGSPGSPSANATDVTATYSLMISRAIQALSMLRSVMPIGNTERDKLLQSRKDNQEREGDVMYTLPDAVNKQVENFKIGDRLASALTMSIDDPTAAGNEKMWNEFIKIADQAKAIIQVYLSSLLKKETPKEGGEDWYDDVLQRSRTEVVKYNEAFASGGNGASESIINAIKIYQKGAIKTLNDSKKGTSIIDFQTIKGNLPSVVEQVKKPLRTINESQNYRFRRSSTLTEREINILKNPSHRLFEKKKRGNLSQVQEASYEGAISTVINLSRTLDATVAYFENSEYYDEVNNAASGFRKKIKEAYEFLTSDSFDNIRNNYPDKLEDIIGQIVEMNDPSDPKSIPSWQKEMFAKYENAVVSDQYIKAGDAELAKATDILNKMNTVSYLKDKEAQNDLDNILGRIQRTAEDDPEKKKTVQQKQEEDKKKQEEELKASLSVFTGGSGGEDLTDRDIQDIITSASLLTGKSYKDETGAINYDEIKGKPFADVFRKGAGLEVTRDTGSTQTGSQDQRQGQDQSQITNQGQSSGNLTTNEAIKRKKEASEILQSLIDNAEDSPVAIANTFGAAKSQKIKEWKANKKELDSTPDGELCSPANMKKVKDSLNSAKKNMQDNGQHLTAREKKECQKLIDMLEQFPQYCGI